MFKWKDWLFLFTILVLTSAGSFLLAQTDTTKKATLDSVLLRQKGLLGQLAQNLLTDTLKADKDLLRNDQPYQPYKGRVIRYIQIRRARFGAAIDDTIKRKGDKLQRLARKLHHDTREFVVANHLFFSEGEKLSPFLMGDNARYLRDLPFIQDAQIKIIPVKGSRDSVDVLVLTKDVFSIGVNFRVHNPGSVSLILKEDNLFGWGDLLQVQGFVDKKRDQKIGQGFAFIKRNVVGSFIDVATGFFNYNRSLSSKRKEESIAYFRVTRPLVNRYMKWSYGGEAELHYTHNFYNPDSLYQQDFKYRYNKIDAWGVLNTNADEINVSRDNDRTYKLIGMRVLQHRFSEVPLKYENQYMYLYSDVKAVLGSFSFFKQNSFKTHYIYGFGRNEDVPEGGEASVTVGWTEKYKRERPYAALGYQRYYFTEGREYFNFSLQTAAYVYNKKLEDINIIGKLDYFSHLRQWRNKWKQRFFLNTSVARQINTVLNEPLLLESEQGLREFKNDYFGGNYRVTLKAESVFFSPWTLLYFRFAPFVFTKATVMNLKGDNISKAQLYSAVGGGIRIRNESLVFGTTEIRAMYFPRKNFSNDTWWMEISTNIRFKYNQEFIRRPEFVQVN